MPPSLLSDALRQGIIRELSSDLQLGLPRIPDDVPGLAVIQVDALLFVDLYPDFGI